MLMMLSLQRTDPATDPTLIAEYHAIILMIQAFQAYQINEEPTPHVIPLATEAIDELRQLLVPLTKSSPAASPPRPGPSASTVKGTNGTARPQNGRTATSARAVSVSTPASKTTKGKLIVNPSLMVKADPVRYIIQAKAVERDAYHAI
jgi:hypothetical protein